MTLISILGNHYQTSRGLCMYVLRRCNWLIIQASQILIILLSESDERQIFTFVVLLFVHIILKQQHYAQSLMSCSLLWKARLSCVYSGCGGAQCCAHVVARRAVLRCVVSTYPVWKRSDTCLIIIVYNSEMQQNQSHANFISFHLLFVSGNMTHGSYTRTHKWRQLMSSFVISGNVIVMTLKKSHNKNS